MKLLWAILGLALPAAIQAADLAPRDPDLIEKVFCLVQVVLVDLLEGCSTATQFCESVQASTQTVTTTTTKTSSSCAFDPPTVTTSTQYETTTTGDSPYPTPADLESYSDWEIVEACACLSIPATDIPTVTVTTTVATTTTLCPIPTTCGNEGLQWAYYNQDDNIYVPSHSASYYLWDPTPIKNAAPVAQGTTTYVFQDIYPPTYISEYGQSQQLPSTFNALNHRGYLYAEQSGTYTFTGNYVDDELLFWAGPLAYSGWDASNYDAFTYSDGPYPVTYNMSLLSGQYLPIRLIYVNAQGRAYLNVTITAPDGTTILGANTTASPNIVQFSCDGTSAPAYPAFGKET